MKTLLALGLGLAGVLWLRRRRAAYDRVAEGVGAYYVQEMLR